jgi:hypothetical protein
MPWHGSLQDLLGREVRYGSGKRNISTARNYGSASGIYYLHTHTGSEDLYTADQLMYALYTLINEQLSNFQSLSPIFPRKKQVRSVATLRCSSC